MGYPNFRPGDRVVLLPGRFIGDSALGRRIPLDGHVVFVCLGHSPKSAGSDPPWVTIWWPGPGIVVGVYLFRIRRIYDE